MKSIITCCCVGVAVLAFATSFGIYHHFSAEGQKKEASIIKLKKELEQSNSQLDNYQDTIGYQKREIGKLSTESAKLKDSLQSVSGQLADANKAIEKHEQEIKAAQDEADKKQSKIDSEQVTLVPPPSVSGISLVFPKIIGVYGQTLATNAVFVQQIGRLLVFRPEGKIAVSFDVDSLHPMMLQHLGIDADGAKLLQKRMDEMWAAKRQADQIQAALNYQAYVADEQRAIEARKAAAAEQSAAAAQQQASADAAKANAVVDAALLNASRPAVQVNTIQQNQQVNGWR